MAWFDRQNQAAVSRKFELDSMTFQLAIGEKVSTIILVVMMLLTGIGISLYTGWILTLVLLAYIPLVIVVWTKNVSVKVETTNEEDNIYR